MQQPVWIKLDDKFWRNPKMRRLSHAARGVFCDSLSYCGDVAADQLTGYLSRQEALERATGNKRLVDEMVDVGCLEVVNGGYLIHDFPDYLPKTSRERTQRWRENKRLERHGDVTEASQPRHIARHGDSESSRARDGKPEPVPEPEPVPVGVKPLSVGSPPTFGLSRNGAQVDGFHGIGTVLGGLRIQPAPREATK